ncbi:LRR receptor-like serine/threonine-protein kinase EFR [Lycium ferocissimum]|uniref:LRR receptor-like serine/threonine-protein kinase EFR n=1 Tax=Lycium ferocissimum TaxID=112874 RepID=UPI002815068B|nr:LRR receptor-like serine/threonine-protein kinase EFR [Lycium ferocissimum]
MDGHRRWARQKGFTVEHGHSAGGEKIKVLIRLCSQWGVKVLTVFAFSAENWIRSKVKYASSGILGNQTDKLALLEFKSKITEDPQGLIDSWNATLNVCQWLGVTCGHKHQRVISLDLKGHRLAGSISPSIGNLSFLRILDISDNSFHGHIPAELGSLTKLEMVYLKNNNLTGNVPSSIGNLTSLRELYISYNDLEGASVNSLSGEFPPALYNLSSLKLIGLSFNKFRGNLRPDIGLAFPNLQRLYLANIYFIGSVPASLSNCSDLLQLDIPINNFTGNIPLSFGNLKNLFWLNKA